jgi:hypothetical protein
VGCPRGGKGTGRWGELNWRARRAFFDAAFKWLKELEPEEELFA